MQRQLLPIIRNIDHTKQNIYKKSDKLEKQLYGCNSQTSRRRTPYSLRETTDEIMIQQQLNNKFNDYLNNYRNNNQVTHNLNSELEKQNIYKKYLQQIEKIQLQRRLLKSNINNKQNLKFTDRTQNKGFNQRKSIQTLEKGYCRQFNDGIRQQILKKWQVRSKSKINQSKEQQFINHKSIKDSSLKLHERKLIAGRTPNLQKYNNFNLNQKNIFELNTNRSSRLNKSRKSVSFAHESKIFQKSNNNRNKSQIKKVSKKYNLQASKFRTKKEQINEIKYKNNQKQKQIRRFCSTISKPSQSIKKRLKLSQIVYSDSKYGTNRHEMDHLNMTYRKQCKMRNEIKNLIHSDNKVMIRYDRPIIE